MPTTLPGAPLRPELARSRWAVPVGLVLGATGLGVAFALTVPHGEPVASPLPEPATAEPLPASTPVAAASPPSTLPTPTNAAATATGAPAPPPADDTAPRPLPPIVLVVQPPVEADALTDAGVAAVAADAGAAPDAGSSAIVPAASASASTAPSAAAPPVPSPAPRMVSVPPISVSCGINTCNVGEVCCNPSCGTCARPGESCDDRQCPATITYPESQSCGMQTCNVGLSCCNASCGICAPPGEPCSQAPCS
jgi:hypothetical protein